MAVSPPPPPVPSADSQIHAPTSLTYWSSTPSTVSGMLGGYPQVSRIDITSSRVFLLKLLRISHPSPHLERPSQTPSSPPAIAGPNSSADSNNSQPSPNSKTSTATPPPPRLQRVADCGAGIGRITVHLLAPLSRHVDVVEPVRKFTDTLREEHREMFVGDRPKIESVFNVGLEDWQPLQDEDGRYDVVWNQWCLGHLTDLALVEYLQRVKGPLRKGGWVVVKENVIEVVHSTTTMTGKKRPRVVDVDAGSGAVGDGEAAGLEDEYDAEDSSVTRTRGKFEKIFKEAGLRVVRTELQRGFGRELGLFPVRMWGLQPVEWAEERSS